MPGLFHRVCRAGLHLFPFKYGVGRIVDRTALGRLRFSEETLLVRCRGGFRMHVLPNDLIGRMLYLTGQFDRVIVDVLRAHARPGDRLLDVGGNIGYVSAAFLHHVQGSRVVAVEPQPRIFQLMKENLERVGGGRATCVNAALSDVAGAGRMQLPGGNTMAAQLVMSGEGGTATAAATEEMVDVRVINAAQLMEVSGVDRIDLVKIDVEGHEEAVFRALAGTIARQRPRAIVFEHYRDLRSPDSFIRRLLEENGYAIWGIRKRLTGWTLRPLRELPGEGAHDYVALAV